MGTATSADTRILRELATRRLEIAHDPINLERRQAWHDLHSRTPTRPMVLAEWGGVRETSPPFAPELRCCDEWARGIERALRQDIWVFETLRDDHAFEPFIATNWLVNCTGYGVQPVEHHVEADHLTAKSWDPPITDISAQFELLQPRRFSVNREATLARKERLESEIGDILPVRIRGSFWWTMGMTNPAIRLIGLEGLMLNMYDDPDGLHRIMRFLCDDHLAFAQWLEEEGLLSLNNGSDYVGSGSCGYTHDVPKQALVPTESVTTQDLWVLLESQETVGVGPSQFEEFIFPYQAEIAERFGLVYYGCCEPVHTRWDVLRRLPHLTSVSVAPLCEENTMAEAMGTDYVYSRKPNPTLISTPRFDEEVIRQDLRATLNATMPQGCPLEIIMKDVHTLQSEPRRLARWVELAREEIGRSA